MTNIQQPPILRGSPQQQLVQIRQYLYQISRDLNASLNNLTEENFAAGSNAAKALAGEASEQVKQETKKQLSSLKSLIIKTADLVYQEMDRIETSLTSTYVAQSDYGVFTENIQGQISAEAARIDQLISYDAEITDNMNSLSAGFDAYVIETQGYIKQGIIGYEDAVPIIGIAIGQDVQVTGTTETVNGKSYDVIDTASNMSIWTPEKLSFWINGAEAAYFSNGALYVGTIYVQSKVIGGSGKWSISFDGPLIIKWIGG